jgi:hypothetical protein
MFEFIVNLEEFRNAGKSVLSGIGNLSTVYGYILCTIENSTLTMRSTNGEKEVIHSIKADVIEEGTFFIEPFLITVFDNFKFPGQGVKFLQTSENTFSVRQGADESKFNIIRCDKFPPPIKMNTTDWNSVNDVSLFEAFDISGIVYHTISNQQPDAYQCYHIDIKNKVVIAGSGVQFVRYESVNFGENANDNILLVKIPQITKDRSLIKDIFDSSDAYVGFSDEYFGFMSESCGLSILYRTLNTKPFELKEGLETIEKTEPDCVIEIDREDLIEKLKLLSQFESRAYREGHSSFTKISINNNEGMKLYFNIKQVSSTECFINPYTITGGIETEIKASVLLKFLSKIPVERLIIEFRKNKAKIKVTAENQNFTYFQA